jgi:uncharacterized protein (DUF58 family)
MKIWRAIFFGLMVFWFLAGAASGIRIFYVMLLLQILLVMAAAGISIWAALTFAYLQELSVASTLRGQPVSLLLDIHNEKPIPFPLMRIRLATPDPLEKRDLNFNLGANSELAFDLPLECPHRGEYLIGMTIIDFIDIFGIVRLPFDMRLLPYYRQKKLLVYPQLNDLRGLTLANLSSQSFSRRQFATDDLQEPFSTIRDYRRGDPRKLIHWKASLRQQKLLTRQFDQSNEPHILLLLDLSKPAGPAMFTLQTIDACCEAAAAMIHDLLRQDWPLRIVSFSEKREVRVGNGLRDFQHLYQWLAQVPFAGDSPFHLRLSGELAQSSGCKAILAITHNPDPAILPVLLTAHRSQIPIFMLFTGLAAEDAALVAQVRQAGLKAWFYHAGDDLATVLGQTS